MGEHFFKKSLALIGLMWTSVTGSGSALHQHSVSCFLVLTKFNIKIYFNLSTLIFIDGLKTPIFTSLYDTFAQKSRNLYVITLYHMPTHNFGKREKTIAILLCVFYQCYYMKRGKKLETLLAISIDWGFVKYMLVPMCNLILKNGDIGAYKCCLYM